MEAAISSSLSHPNLVQTLTYTLEPVSATRNLGAESASLSTSSDLTQQPSNGFEVRLVLELCEYGTLRQALDAGAFATLAGVINYPAILDTAIDIAKGMRHLHQQNVVHSDLKGGNILLAKSADEPRGFLAKV